MAKPANGYIFINQSLQDSTIPTYLIVNPYYLEYGHYCLSLSSTLLLSIAGPITAGSYILAMYSRSVMGLYLMRLLQGFAMSATFLISPIYLGEIAEVHIRGMIGTLMQISIHLGILYTYCLGTELSYHHYQMFSLVIPILFMATFILMPESPYYYVMKQEEAKAVESLKRLRNKKEEELEDEMRDIKLSTNKKDDVEHTSCSEFFESSNMKALVFILCLTLFRQFSGVQTIIAYANTIFASSASFLPADYISIFFAIILLVSIFPSTYLVDKSGRKVLMLTSSAGCAVFSLIAGVYFYLTTELHYEIPYTSWVPFASVSLVGVFFNVGFGPVFTPIMSEYFSSSMKAASSAVINLWGTTLGLVCYKLFYILNIHFGLYSNFLFSSVCCSVCTIFLYCFMLETKGKTFAQIQYMFKCGGKDKNITCKPSEEEDMKEKDDLVQSTA